MVQKLNLMLIAFFICGLMSVQAQMTVKGTVVDGSNGDPIPGVNITEKGTSKGVVTDFDGNYAIDVGASATLQFSYVGYATQSIPVNGKETINLSSI